MSGSIREPSFEAKMLLEAIEDEVHWLRTHGDDVRLAVADALEDMGDRFVGKVHVKD